MVGLWLVKTHSSEMTFREHLLCARHCDKCWRQEDFIPVFTNLTVSSEG